MAWRPWALAASRREGGRPWEAGLRERGPWGERLEEERPWEVGAPGEGPRGVRQAWEDGRREDRPWEVRLWGERRWELRGWGSGARGRLSCSVPSPNGVGCTETHACAESEGFVKVAGVPVLSHSLAHLRH